MNVGETENRLSQLEVDPPFEVLECAEGASPVLFSSPHSGNMFPASFLAASRLSPEDMRLSADLYVDALLAGAVVRGVTLIKAHFPRCFVDVNREPYELDPKMFDGPLPGFVNAGSARVASGYGTLARLVSEQHAIYSRRLPVSEALTRIDTYYLPYHAALQRLLQASHRMFGYALLIDWHSMPSAVFPAYRQVDVVLGDRHGTSCDPELTHFVEDVLRGAGLRVQRNQPYAGGFITERYGRPERGAHALQIELNRALYMNEAEQNVHDGFSAMAECLMNLTDALVAFDQLSPVRIAAE